MLILDILDNNSDIVLDNIRDMLIGTGILKALLYLTTMRVQR